MATKTLNPKLKILCLHGYAQNSTIFYKKAGYLRTALKAVAECEFPSGTMEIQLEDENSRQQFQASDNSAALESNSQAIREPNQAWFRAIDLKYVGIDVSLQFLRNYIIEKGPFDGIMGFSQGAVMASILNAMIENFHPSINEDKSLLPFKFGIFLGGLYPRDTSFHKLLENKQKLPSLHVWGSQDTLVLPETSEKLSSCYSNPEILVHDGGHVLPTRSIYKRTIVDFITKHSESSGNSNDPTTSVNIPGKL